MGKKSKKGRTANKPKHHAAGAGRKSTGSVVSDVMSQSQANSVDGFANKTTVPTSKAPPMNVMVPSPMPEQKSSHKAAVVEDTEEPTPSKSNDDAVVASPSSTAESTPETSPAKVAVPEVVEEKQAEKETVSAPVDVAPKTEKPKPEAATTPAMVSDSPNSPVSLSVNTDTPLSDVPPATESMDVDSKSQLQQHPVTPDEVMRSTVSLRDQFDSSPEDDSKAVLDVTVDDIAVETNDKEMEPSGTLNLSAPSFQEANDVAPQGSECCIIQ